MASEAEYRRSRSSLLNLLWQKFNRITSSGSNSKLPGGGAAGGAVNPIAFLKINHSGSGQRELSKYHSIWHLHVFHPSPCKTTWKCLQRERKKVSSTHLVPNALGDPASPVDGWQGCLEEAAGTGVAWDKLRKRRLLPFGSQSLPGKGRSRY